MTTMRVVGECFFWYRLTRVFPDKFHRAVKQLCVCVCVQVLIGYFAGVSERQHTEAERTLPPKLWPVGILSDSYWPCCLDLSRTCQVDRSQAAANDWCVVNNISMLNLLLLLTVLLFDRLSFVNMIIVKHAILPKWQQNGVSHMGTLTSQFNFQHGFPIPVVFYCNHGSKMHRWITASHGGRVLITSHHVVYRSIIMQSVNQHSTPKSLMLLPFSLLWILFKTTQRVVLRPSRLCQEGSKTGMCMYVKESICCSSCDTLWWITVSFTRVVGALLENEAISGLSESKQLGLRRTSSGPAEVVRTPDDLIAVVSWASHSYVIVTITQEIIECVLHNAKKYIHRYDKIWLVYNSTCKVENRE